MKQTFFILISFLPAFLFAQKNNLEVEVFQLENGLTVYLNEDSTVNRVFGAVAVNAGSKNDPADATGIAHYLEHLLFKGTEEMGTWNFEAEKPLLDSITYWYDELGKTRVEEERKIIQSRINNLSVQAAKYSLPNDFDNLLKGIGSTGVNAFTSPDMTFYHNSFPPNQILNWLEIFSHRFQKPVFRSFQSELEVVYEEKNRAMDEFGYEAYEKVVEKMFEPHPYGTQTTLGKTEHLKNPSLKKMYQFFNDYYVANNMALILTGNFKSEEIKETIQEKFGVLRTGDVPNFKDYPVKKFQGKEVTKKRYTPIKALAMGYKTVPTGHPDEAALKVANLLLSNSNETGYFDQLTKENKVLAVQSLNESLNDAGVAILVVVPKIIMQSFKNAEKHVFGALDKLKNGEFDQHSLNAAKQELYMDFQTELENITDRGIAMGYAFSQGRTWSEYLSFTERINKVSREDVERVAQKYYGNDYFALYSRMGFPKKEKLKQPGYKSLAPEDGKESSYAKAFKQRKGLDMQPQFLNLKDDVTFIDLRNNNRLYVTENPVNDIYTITIKYQFGNDNNRDISLAARLMNQAGTQKRTALELNRSLGEIGASYNVRSERNFLTISLTGIEETLPKALELLNELVQQPIISQKAVDYLHKEEKTNRRLEKRNPSEIGTALRLYALYQKNSPLLTRHSLDEIKNADINKMTQKFKEGIDYAAAIHYVGNRSGKDFKNVFLKHYKLNTKGKRKSMTYAKSYQYIKPKIYFIHSKKALQSQIYFYVNGEDFKKKDYPYYQAFNTYFGDGFSGLVLQEIREYRSLAYSAWGRSFFPYKSGVKSFLNSFVGCQADKTNEAIGVMMDLIKDLPKKPERMEQIRSSLQQKAFTDYPEFRRRSQFISTFRTLGFKKTLLEEYYPEYAKMTFKDITNFYQEKFQDKPVVITIYGNKKQIDFNELGKYGEVIELKTKDVIAF